MKIIGLILLLYIGYTCIPTILARMFGYKVYKRRRTADHVYSLTFDDGPHPVYTPILLDLLKKYNIKATFFIVGEQGRKYPELLKRIDQEGHTLGIHQYRHVSNWLLSPRKQRQMVEETAQIIESVTGAAPVYYRPPWGLLNLLDWQMSRQYPIILWDVMVGDWRNSKGRKDQIKQRLLSKLKSGSIIVLHDNGDTAGAFLKAPETMILNLQLFFEEVQGHYFCIPLDQLLEGIELQSKTIDSSLHL